MLYIKNEMGNNNEIIINNILFEQIFDSNNKYFSYKFTNLASKEIIHTSESFNVGHLEDSFKGLISGLLYLINKNIFDIGLISNIELRRIINQLHLFFKEINKHNVHSYHDLRNFELVPSHVLTMKDSSEDFIIINDINQVKNKDFNVEIYRNGLHYYYNLSFKKEMYVPLIFNYLNSVKSYNFISIKDNLYRGYDNITMKNTLKKELRAFYNELLYNLA